MVPGKMRSDREEIPEGFTKEQADLAETMEAQQQSSRMSLMSLPCTTYWPAPFLVCGEIRVKYESLGGPNSFLKWPINNELTNPDGVGKRSEFMVGPIYWHPTTGAHPVVNSFMTKWGSHGWEGGFIGYPTTDEIVNPDGIGRRQEFQNAAIYWHPLTTINGAVIGGAIRDKWNTLGAETNGSRLGYPTSDELVNTDTVGRRQSFAGGLMYWSPSTGAHPVTGVVQAVWSFKNYEIGEYGYPVDDGVFGPDGNRQEFQHGGITFGLPVDASGKTGVYLNGCHLMTGNPHVSGHKPWTIDTETEGNCSQPKRYIQATTFIWKVNTGADCGRGMCEIDAGTAMGSAGDGETIQENLRFRFTSARQCEEADFFAATEWEMTNADGSHWEDIIVTDTFHLGGPERPCAEAPEDYVPEPLIPGGGGGSW
ncbi:hypothetical protein BKE56_028110 [Rhodococcus sp. M8]|nr:hypothetical protein BKE56_028110 [Rhodococcus sp. M8]